MVSRALPEFRLATACAIWPPSDRRSEAICVAAAELVDWPRFIRVVERHRVTTLVHDGLTRARPNVPQEVAREIGARAAVVVRDNLERAAEAMRVQRMFDEAKIPVLFVKGSSLAALAFGNLGLSGGQDIDMLVPSDRVPVAAALLSDAGYRRFDPPPNIGEKELALLLPFRKDLGLVHQKTGHLIELHWRLFVNPHAMPRSPFALESQVVALAAGAGVRTLGDEDLFAYLCMHGALHWWNRLKWLADVNAFITSRPVDAIEGLIRASEVRGAGRAAAQALLLCQRLFGTSLPSSLMTKFDRNAIVRWLEDTAVRAMTTGQGEYEPHDVRFGTTRGSLSTLLLSPSWRYGLAELNAQFTNQADILTMPLPNRLRFLYPFLRLPLWVYRQAQKR